MALRDVRLRELREDVVRKGSVQVAAMARDHQVSQETIRRDLDRLADLGLIVRTRGGAVAPGSSLTELDVHVRAREHRAEKRAIATAVAERLVTDGTSVALDTGSTVLEVARALRSRRITVITSSLPVINELAGTACSVVVLGGSLRARSLSMVGPMAERYAEQFHCDLALVSAPALTPELGPMDTDLDTIEIKRALIRGAHRVYAVVDHSKLGKTAFSTICALEALTGVVTDDGADPSILSAFQAAGLDIIVGVRTHD